VNDMKGAVMVFLKMLP